VKSMETTLKMKNLKTWKDVQADPRVADTCHDGTSEGYWVYLIRSVYSPSTECRTIHEFTVKAVIEQLNKVESCDVDEIF
tara:strand:+ start:270 stop:509 length:240 start_codon:yes stop_codon:yes gene_type:complete